VTLQQAQASPNTLSGNAAADGIKVLHHVIKDSSFALEIECLDRFSEMLAIHFHVQLCSNGQVRSLSAIAATGRGHRMPSFGSSKRTPAELSEA